MAPSDDGNTQERPDGGLQPRAEGDRHGSEANERIESGTADKKQAGQEARKRAQSLLTPLRLSIAQQRAIYNPVSGSDDLRNVHHHQYKDVHGRVVNLSLTVCRYMAIQFGRPVWDCRVSLGNGKLNYRLTNDRLGDAYAAAVIGLMGCGEDDYEYVNLDSHKTVICVRVTLTDQECDILRKINAGQMDNGYPHLWPIDFEPQQTQPRPAEHVKRHKWMDDAHGTVFEQTDVKDPTKQMVKGPGNG